MKKLLVGIVILLCVTSVPVRAEAKTIYRYITQKVSLKETRNKKSATIEKLHQNDKVILLKKGKRWSRVKHRENVGYCKTKYMCKWKSPKLYTRKQFKRRGRIRWRGWSWTWYTQRILPGRSLPIKGRHLDKQGFVCDKDGYIVLASSIGYKKQRKILPTPFGKYGKVYDTNGTWNYGWRDVFTNW